MGYMIYQEGAEFRIPADKLDACWAAIKAIPFGDPHVGNGGGYSWVGDYINAPTVDAAFAEWRWAIHRNMIGGDVIDIEFTGEKYADDMTVFLDAIAPFVEPGSCIEMRGEEGELWRWVFDGSDKVNEVYARVVWP